nr:MAG TPA: hypothetical protein [Caudoviricetes sp.]
MVSCVDNSNSLSIDTKHHIQNIHIKTKLYSYKRLLKTTKELSTTSKALNSCCLQV